MMVDNEVHRSAERQGESGTVRTVLGPVAVGELGVVAVSESLLSVLPGAQYAYDIVIDRAEIFDVLAAKLRDFKAAGGGTIVDTTGMYHGRDVPMLEALSKATGVHIVASTGLGPEANLGGYFLTPQTNPPTPWPAERFAQLFADEITKGMVIPRIERRGSAGAIAAVGTRGGITPSDESIFIGAARAAAQTGTPAFIRFGARAAEELDLVLGEGVAPDRIIVSGVDRVEAAASASAVAARGVYVLLERVGYEGEGYLTDAERAALVAELIAAGYRDNILVSAGATGVAKGIDDDNRVYESVLTSFLPLLETHGVDPADALHLVTTNAAAALAGKEA